MTDENAIYPCFADEESGCKGISQLPSTTEQDQDMNLIPAATQDHCVSKLIPVVPLQNSPDTSQTVISVVQA